MNGNSCNGKHRNGTKIDARVLTYEKPKNSEAPLIDSENHKENQEYQDDKFEQSVVLRQSPVWSRAIMLSMIGLACVGIGWASFAKIEQVVPATGQLKPEGTVKEIQAPVSGVVKKVYVKDGQQVKPDDLLLIFDSTATNAELNSFAGSNKKVLAQIADNKKRIAEIDSQLTKIMLDNEKQLADVNSKISQAETNVKYQELRAPVAGVVFDLQAKNSGFVAKGSEELLKIVPSDKFIAEAFITNKDIGFVRKGMKVDVRIDSFPFSEFGDIKGEVISVGSDALPPTETHPYYRFPATIRLNEQSLNVKGKSISLQSGMSISANIKVREERRVISLFTELFTKQIESLKQVR
jgi:HlyD family secretion protein